MIKKKKKNETNETKNEDSERSIVNPKPSLREEKNKKQRRTTLGPALGIFIICFKRYVTDVLVHTCGSHDLRSPFSLSAGVRLEHDRSHGNQFDSRERQLLKNNPRTYLELG